ncbi:hypothetical protein [Frankia sp. QA3]|uniref:hypothetical protein n=1 Tax=Frankia sp. QA3 TaxID=710111 RepID=UPI000269BBE5|nr:hypothetical protein [Frankia sp. QA3]EIV92182.1 hypothetical protein FraQA3DRAFT_1706 [Frankia sp. QA3]
MPVTDVNFMIDWAVGEPMTWAAGDRTILDAADHLDPTDTGLRARQLRDTAQAILRGPDVKTPTEAVSGT